MSYEKLNLPEFTHAVLIDGELMVLDELTDKYHFLDLEATNKFINTLSVIKGSLSPSVKIYHYSARKHGVGNLAWHQQSDLRRRKVPIYMQIMGLIYAIIFFIRYRRFRLHAILSDIRHEKNKRNLHCANEIQEEKIKLMCAALSCAAIWLPFRIKCFEMSSMLALYALRRNLDCRFVIGVQRYDFLSHAWVELNGVPVCDRSDLSENLIQIISI
jgi:hypothetical protein